MTVWSASWQTIIRTRIALLWSTVILGYSAEHWRLFAEMGWLALPFAEQHGGFGGTPVDTAILMETLGRGLVLEPYLSTVVLAGGLVALAGSEVQQADIIPQIIAGDLTLALAYLEPGSGFDPCARCHNGTLGR